ncbi:MAG: CPBP family intramembrane metalloprotease [Phycisphaerales bacterium]|jgi:membrane protease YdiL (CAAX protease family)|nr:CPBP family intramembrane metalloprotease [Phycisphaerales bacterium]
MPEFPPNPFSHPTPAAVLDGTPPTPPVATDRLPDPGSPGRRSVALLLVAILTIAVAVVQRLDHAPAAAPDPKSAAIIHGSDEVDLMGRLFVKLGLFFKAASPGAPVEMYAEFVDEQAKLGTPTDRVWAAIAAGELSNTDAAKSRLEKVTAELDAPPDPATTPAPNPASNPAAPTDEAKDALRKDIQSLNLIYEGRAAELTQEQRDALGKNHGFFGKIALTHGLKDEDPARAPLLSGGGRLLAIMGAFMLVLVVGALAGITLFIIAIIKLMKRSVRATFRAPARGGSAYLEAFALFLLAFLVLALGTALLEQFLRSRGANTDWIGPASLLAHWLLALVPLYVLTRGRSFAGLRQDMGWNTGRGVFREVGAGIAGYLAGLPLFFVSVLLALVLLVVQQAIVTQMTGHKPAPPSNPLFDRIGQSSGLEMAILFFMATVWAPIVEESLFRGVLFRHLRGTVGVVLAALGSAFVFGIIHPVPVLLTIPLMTLGFNFAMMREWRGSLLAPMTAHCLHNATVLTLLISVMSVVKD